MSRRNKAKLKWQVGNFFVRLIEICVGYQQKIEALEISDNERNWKIQIPQHWSAFAIIRELLKANEEKDMEILTTLFCNMHCVCCVMDGNYHKDVMQAGVNYMSRVSKEKPEVDEDYAKATERIAEAKAEIDQIDSEL